jgi:hypothetical protein
MTSCPISNWSFCRPTLRPAQLEGVGVASRCKSDLKGLYSDRRILLLTQGFVGTNLASLQLGAPLLVAAALPRIQSP